jgi:hypothetical protein
MHENAHNQGAVPYGSPNSTGTGAHCDEGEDVLCYTPDGGDRNQEPLSRVCSYVEFDCNADDYFDAAPELGEYLATHWNLGSPLNRFIEFGVAGVEPEPPIESTPESCEARRCATRLRLRVPAQGEIRAGATVLYRLALRRPLNGMRVSVRASAPVSVAIRRASPPARRIRSCSRPGPGAVARRLCTVRSPATGPWYIAVRATADADAGYALVVRGVRRPA